MDFFPIPFLQFGYNSIWKRVRLSEPVITGVPDTGCFPLLATVLDFGLGLGWCSQILVYKACVRGDCLSTLKECNVGLKGTCYHSEPLKAANIQAPLEARTLPISTQRTGFDWTQSDGSSGAVTFGSVVFCIIYTSARFKCSALQWTGTEESRFKSPSKGFSA